MICLTPGSLPIICSREMSTEDRLTQHREASFSGFPATVREPQKVKRSRFAVATVSPVSFRIASELDDPGFVGMQFQPKLRESLTQFRQEPLGFVTMLESRDEI